MSASSLTSSSPFASMAPELLAGIDAKPASLDDAPVDILEDFGETGVYENDDELDPLSAMEKYCRSELPQQRLAYAAGIGAAAEIFQPHEVSGTVISLLRELLQDVYADVRHTALQQVLPVVRRLRCAGTLYQPDIEVLWDLVQKLLLDADVENQEAASAVLAEVSHEVAKGNPVAASQKLVLAVQKLQRLPAELCAEGALASLRLLTQVVAPRSGSPLTFATIEEFAVGTFKAMISSDVGPDVRQAVVLLLPHFARHMPDTLKASLLSGWVKTLASDTHWNVRAEVPQLLINLLTPQDSTNQQKLGLADEAVSSSEDGHYVLVAGQQAIHKWSQTKASATAVAAGCVAESWSGDDLKMVCDIIDKLCRDTSAQVKVAALSSLGQLLPLLPAALLVNNKPPLLAQFAATATPSPQTAGVKVPASLCTPKLTENTAHRRRRQHQQRSSGAAQDLSSQQALQKPTSTLENNTALQQDCQQATEAAAEGHAPGGGALTDGPQTSTDAANNGSTSSSSSSSDNPACLAVSSSLEGQQDASGQQLYGRSEDSPMSAKIVDGLDSDAQTPSAVLDQPGAGNGAANLLCATDSSSQQQQQSSLPVMAPGTAGAELPRACALHMGKVALHTGIEVWQQQLQGAFLQLAAAALHGDCNVAAALLLAFPTMAEALAHQESATILVPVVLELLHTQLDTLALVLSVTVLDVLAALAPELRICLLQMLPSVVLQTDSEFAGNWRARLSVVQQLSAIAGLVSRQQVAYCLWPLVTSLLKDPVWAVRSAAAQQIGLLLLHMPDHEQPPEQQTEVALEQAAGEQAAAAPSPSAAAAAPEHVHEQEGAASATASAGASAADVDIGAVEHAVATAVATHAVNTNSAQQQDQPAVACAPAERLGWMRRGLTTGLSQLQQQVDKVMEMEGVQKALNGMDQQLTWLQQHPQGKVLWNIGSMLAQGVLPATDTAGAAAGQVTLEDLQGQLTSIQLIEAAKVDPCRLLGTPAWQSLARDVVKLGGSHSCSERAVFVLAAASIMDALKQRQSDGSASGTVMQHMLWRLHQLSSDPTPGVRSCVAEVCKLLLSKGVFAQDVSLDAFSRGCSSESLQEVDMMLGSTTASTTMSPVEDSTIQRSRTSSSSHPGTLLTHSLQQPQPDTASHSAGGVSSIASSSVLCGPETAVSLLQDCLTRLSRDPCVSVAEAACVEPGLCHAAIDPGQESGSAAGAVDVGTSSALPLSGRQAAVRAAGEEAGLL